MNKYFLLIIFFCFHFSFSQNESRVIIEGVVMDKNSSETLPLANVVIKDLSGKIIKGATANSFGKFKIHLDISSETKLAIINVSYIGYSNYIKTLDLTSLEMLTIQMKTEELNAVDIISDQAEFRKTPVSLSNVPLKKIERESSGRNISMMLKSAVGVYVTETGGGDGDVRINIRGFNQRNVAVMIDGIPMNDMENGWVYWSNWFGLDLATRTMQVQRGLGASKLALPSVGGTINIITKGIDSKEGGKIRQEIGSGNSIRTSFAYTSKDYKLGKFNIVGSFKKSDGLIDQTGSKAFFYYLKWQKRFKNHLLSLTTFGAPQEHFQRKYQTGMAVYDKEFAANQGIDTASVEGGYGLTYNPNWGSYNDYEVIFENGIAVDTLWGNKQYINKHKNYYHKPNFSFQHLWNINGNSSLTNIIYYSRGKGGGTNYQGGTLLYTDNNQIDFQQVYDANHGNIWNSFINPGGPAIDLAYSDSEKKSTGILNSSINNHYWGGFLSTFNSTINKNFDFASGLDIRTYKGEHYREVYDLLGGDYYVGSAGSGSKNSIGENNDNLILREGDKIFYNNDGLVKWIGGFSQLEYNYKNITAFINLTGSNSSYKRIDYFKKKDLVLTDTTLTQAVGVNDTINYNGNTYTIDSEEARFTETKWKHLPGFTIKTGANWNIDEHNNVFFNTGLLSKAPRFANVFNYDNETYFNIRNEIIQAFELGYGYVSEKFALNFNAYNTLWKNKPESGTYSNEAGETSSYNINGIDALHQGLELDFAWKISQSFKYDFLSSIGKWKWISGDTVNLYSNQQLVASEYFDARGVSVGDSPQIQIGSSINYSHKFNEKISTYITLKGLYYDRFYADFNPFTLNDDKVVWRIPGYTLFDLHFGNTIKFKESSIKIKFNVLNLFNTTYISDAANNSTYVEDSPMNSDAASASVFFGMPRRLTASITYKF